jgi:hypothetical protein
LVSYRRLCLTLVPSSPGRTNNEGCSGSHSIYVGKEFPEKKKNISLKDERNASSY